MRTTLLLAACLSSPGCLWMIGTIPPEKLPPELRAEAHPWPEAIQLTNLGSSVQGEYRAEPGDLLEISVAHLFDEEHVHTISVRVSEAGSVRLPLVGDVTLARLTVPECEEVIRNIYSEKGVLRKPDVKVTPRETQKARVFVVGAVNKPGQYELNGGEGDLLSALAAAGGTTVDAGTTIEIHRRKSWKDSVSSAGVVAPSPDRATSARHGQETVPERGGEGIQQVSAHKPAPGTLPPTLRFDLANESDQRKLGQGVGVRSGDVIRVEERKTKPIYVVGMVNKPGEYKIAPDRDIHVLEAVGLAGGVDRNSLPDKAVVIREAPDGSERVTIRIDLNRAKRHKEENIRLMLGDIVSVEETVTSYLRGLMRGALRLGVGADVNPAF